MMTDDSGCRAALVDGELVAGDVAHRRRPGRSTVGLPPAAGGRIAAPGLVDLQVNGFAGVDLMAADVEEMRALARALPRHGVTAFLPTLITAAATDTDRALDRLGEAFRRRTTAPVRRAAWASTSRARTSRRAGSAPTRRSTAATPTWRSWTRWRTSRRRGRGDPRAGAARRARPGQGLAADGVLVSLGHSDATAHEAAPRLRRRRPDGDPPLQRDEPDAATASRACPAQRWPAPDVVVQLVLDGHHLAPEVVRVVWAAARGRVVLVTDATAAAGRPDGRYALAGVDLDVTDGAVRNPDGTLAGSALTLSGRGRQRRRARDRSGRGAARRDRAPGRAASAATTSGSLRPGARADVTVFDDDLALRETYARRAGGAVDTVTSLLTAEIAEQPRAGAACSTPQLPRLDGWRAALRADEHRRDRPGGAGQLRQRRALRAVPLVAAHRSPCRRWPRRACTPSTADGSTCRGKAVVALSQSGRVARRGRGAGRGPRAGRAGGGDHQRPDVAARRGRDRRARPGRRTGALGGGDEDLHLIGAGGRRAGGGSGRPGRRRPSTSPSCRGCPTRWPPRSTRTTGSRAGGAPCWPSRRRGVVVGRGLNLGTAYEAALKLTELTGSLMAPYSPADLLHGPVAALGPDVPVLAVAPDEPASASVLELAARGGRARRARCWCSGPTGVGRPDAVLPRRRGDARAWLTPLPAVVPGPAARPAGGRGPRGRRRPAGRPQQGHPHDLISSRTGPVIAGSVG